MTLRADLYRGFQKRLIKPAVLPWVFARAGLRSSLFSEFLIQYNPALKKSQPIGWFHAASVGELEMLIPVIEKWCGKNGSVIVTIFSESADGALKKQRERLLKTGAKVLFTGFAPWEGEWKDALTKVKPDFFVTARYEAWPELWMALSERKIPLLVVGAKARPSLTWAKRVCGWLGQDLPQMSFRAVGEEDVAGLKSEFPSSDVTAVGDPRWERVMQRASQGNPRARELIQSNEKLPRPWGVIGSAWPEDLQIFKDVLNDKNRVGTLWVVPHKIDEVSLKKMKASLEGVPYRLTEDGAGNESASCVVVNEMGFLAELYSAADWAYVGGGFTLSVHNTVEPAIYGIPVACGPKRASRFPEIALLESYGQLCQVQNSQELLEWLNTVQKGTSEKERSRWKEFAQAQLGASDEILKHLLTWVSV